jgi:hypothetical protein
LFSVPAPFSTGLSAFILLEEAANPPARTLCLTTPLFDFVSFNGLDLFFSIS